jgi:hypothetical protein
MSIAWSTPNYAAGKWQAGGTMVFSAGTASFR